MIRLTIHGFGLIGGSVGLAARQAGVADRVTAIDRPEVLSLARERRAADQLVDASDREACERAVRDADLTVLAGPVDVIASNVVWALQHGAVVTDAGSTKRRILAEAARSGRAQRFVAGHPMTGVPYGGLARARADLFEGRPWLICPGSSAPDALALAENLATKVGARLVHLEPDAHDAAVARTSHLPQLLASAMLALGHAHASKGAAGPAFERVTLAAGGSAPVWREIFASNGDQVARAIRELCAELEPIAQELTEGHTERAEDLLERARRLVGS